ncbi:PilN domain-containing protein [Aquipuribacter sp. MA13-6]|uniref:PilN domain-containing protein n=1 Tax=unclassified Aquipuribacter TaxID=2635084 RepID=UPI003EEAB1BB
MSTQQQETTRETVVPLTGEYPVARVDLMPPEVLERRRFKRAQAWMVVGVVGVVSALGAGYYLSYADAQQAAEDLAVEQQRTTVLQAEAAQFAQVPAILASVDRAESALATAMATDVEWYRYLSEIGQSAPDTVWFETITAFAAEPVDVAGSDPLAPVDAVAEVTATGRALTYPDVATWLDSLDGISHLDYVLFNEAVRDDETGEKPWVDFTTSAKVGPEAYSDRYAQEGQ